MLKGYYSNIEIAKIVCACKTIEELLKTASCLLDLHHDYEILDIKFFELMSNKRIIRILKQPK